MTPHLIYSKETTPYTWVTPARWLRVESAQYSGGRMPKPMKETGVGRVVDQHVLGEQALTDAWTVKWRPLDIGTLFSTFMLTSAITAVDTGVKDHAFLYDDDAAFLALSYQKQYNSSLGYNYLGGAVNGITFNLATKEEARFDLDLLVKDKAKCGGTWNYDGVTASPALIGTPAYSTLLRPFMFYDASIIYGGTPALDGTTKKLSIGSGTASTRLKNLSIPVQHNLDADAYGLAQDPTLQRITPGDRSIDPTFDMDWTNYSTTFIDAMEALTPMALSIDLVGPIISGAYHYEAHIVIPSLVFEVELPTLDGDNAGKTQKITAHAQKDSTTGVDFGLWIRTSEATL